MVASGHIRRVTDAENDVTVFTVVGAVDTAEVSGHIMAFLTGLWYRTCCFINCCSLLWCLSKGTFTSVGRRLQGCDKKRPFVQHCVGSAVWPEIL
jgi:hypothetical protein